MKGKYAREYATTVSPYDYAIFCKLTRHLYMRHPNIWVRRVEVGDIITSKTKILRWKIVEDDKSNLYLAYIEDKEHTSGYRHGKVSVYHVECDLRGNSTQYYMLYRLQPSSSIQMNVK